MNKKTGIAIILFLVLLCSCAEKVHYEEAVLYDVKMIDNNYDNLLSGGHITFFDSKLYICHSKDGLLFDSLYCVDDSGVKLISRMNNSEALFAEAPRLFNDNHKLYGVDFFEQKIVKYDDSINKFVDSEYDIKPNSAIPYLSDDLKVWCSGVNELSYQYKNDKPITVSDVFLFYVRDKLIYYQDYYGRLLMLDCTESKSTGQLISSLSQEHCSDKMIIVDNYCYYNSDDGNDSSYKTGFYCYSLKNNRDLLLSNNTMCSMVSYQNKIYATDGDCIYVIEGEKFTKIGNISAQEIYIVDEEWIYLYNYGNEFYRILREDSSKIEHISI